MSINTKKLEEEATRILRTNGYTRTGRDLRKERADAERDPKPEFAWEPKGGIHFFPRAAYHYG